MNDEIGVGKIPRGDDVDLSNVDIGTALEGMQPAGNAAQKVVEGQETARGLQAAGVVEP